MPSYESFEGNESRELEGLIESLRSREEYDEETKRIVSDWIERNKQRIDQDPTGRARVEFDADHAELYFRSGYPGKAINIFYDLPDAALELNNPAVNMRVERLGKSLITKLREVRDIKRNTPGTPPEDIQRYEEMVEHINQLNKYFTDHRKQ